MTLRQLPETKWRARTGVALRSAAQVEKNQAAQSTNYGHRCIFTHSRPAVVGRTHGGVKFFSTNGCAHHHGAGGRSSTATRGTDLRHRCQHCLTRWQFGCGAEINGQLVKRGRRLEEWLVGVIIHGPAASTAQEITACTARASPSSGACI